MHMRQKHQEKILLVWYSQCENKQQQKQLKLTWYRHPQLQRHWTTQFCIWNPSGATDLDSTGQGSFFPVNGRQTRERLHLTYLCQLEANAGGSCVVCRHLAPLWLSKFGTIRLNICSPLTGGNHNHHRSWQITINRRFNSQAIRECSTQLTSSGNISVLFIVVIL